MSYVYGQVMAFTRALDSMAEVVLTGAKVVAANVSFHIELMAEEFDEVLDVVATDEGFARYNLYAEFGIQAAFIGWCVFQWYEDSYVLIWPMFWFCVKIRLLVWFAMVCIYFVRGGTFKGRARRK